MVDEGKTFFYDGMRVSREHLLHMEDLLLDAVRDIRTIIGLGKICWGLRATAKDSSSIEVGEGLAFDRKGRRISVKEPQILQASLSEGSSAKYLVIKHKLEEKKLGGDAVNTILDDSFDISFVDALLSENQDSITIAFVKKKEEGFEVDQSMAPYITAIDHTHSAKLIESDNKFIFDGKKNNLYQPIFPEPNFDSGFVPVENGENKKIIHNLKSYGLLVQIIKKSEEIKNLNNHAGYWYELPDLNSIIIHNDIDRAVKSNVQFKVLIWKFGAEVEGIKVPHLLGMSKEDAEKTLSYANLTVGELSARETEHEQAGKVVEQNPGENALVTPNTTIDLVFGERKENEKVPNVTGLSKYKAEKTLEASGWKYKFIPVSVSEPNIKIGMISKQNPEPGTFADKTDKEIELSIGLYNLEVEAIEGIGEKFGKKFRELSPPINTLEDLSLIDETKIKIKGISEEGLSTWKYMASLMTTIEGLDGNGAEILVKCKNTKTPDELANILDLEFPKFYNECIECAKKIKIPKDYIKNYFTPQNVKKWVMEAQKIITQ